MVRTSSNIRFTADMSAQGVAHELDVDLESGDFTGVEEPELVSSDSIKEIVKCLYEMHLEMVNFNLKCKEDIWNNQEFFLLLKDYFQNSLMALDFCTALEDRLKLTNDNQLIVQSAVKQFEEEVRNGVDGVKYVKTLHELSKFKDAEDPFTYEFSQPFPSVYKQHKSVRDKLQFWKTKLDNKLELVKTWRMVFNVFFVVAFVIVLVLMVVAAAVKAPAWATALTGALSVPMGYVGKLCNSFFKKRLRALERKRGVINSMRDGTLTATKDLGNIGALISKLQIETDSVLEKADLALGEEEAVPLVIDAIQKKLEKFMNIAQDLKANADGCRGNSVRLRKFVLQSMFRRAHD